MIAEATGWRGLKPFAEFLGVSEKKISTYLPQKYKLKIVDKSPVIEDTSAKTMKKADTTMSETAKAVLSAPIAEAKKADIVASIETTYPKALRSEPRNRSTCRKTESAPTTNLHQIH